MATDDEIREILGMRTWAVVGCSPDPRRTSHQIAAWLQARGHRIVPVHPAGGEVLGERCFASLAEVPFPVDVVDVFRRSAQAGAHVDEAIAVGAKAVWLQLGVVDAAALGRAHDAGLLGVQDTCPKIEAPRLGVSGPR